MGIQLGKIVKFASTALSMTKAGAKISKALGGATRMLGGVVNKALGKVGKFMNSGVGKVLGKLTGLGKFMGGGNLTMQGIVRQIKFGLIDAEVGHLEPSIFTLKNLVTEEEIILPMTPEELQVKTAALFRNYLIVEAGEIKIPRGSRLPDISWQGILPDASALLQGIGRQDDWDKPEEIAKDFERWQSSGDKIHFIATNTPINYDFYIQSFDVTAWKMGHYKYTIALIAAQELQVKTVAEVDKERAEQAELKKRPPRQKSKLGKRLTKIDNIYSVAQFLTGNGSLSSIEGLLAKNGVPSLAIKVGKMFFK